MGSESGSNPNLIEQLKDTLLSDVRSLIQQELKSFGSSVSASQSPSNGSVPSAGDPEVNAGPDNSEGEDLSDTELDPLAAVSNKTWDPPQPTKEALTKYVRKSVDKDTRIKLLERFPLPALPVVKLPTVDQSVQQIMAQKRTPIRTIAGALALEAVQSRLLDAIGPLSAVHAAAYDAKCKGVLMNPEAVIEAVNHSLVMIGNANAQAIYQRQRLILQKVNPGATPYLTKDKLAVDSEELFGPTVRKAIKEGAEMRKDFCVGNAPQVTGRFNSQRPFRGRGASHNGKSFRFAPYEARKSNFRPGYRQPNSTFNAGRDKKEFTRKE